MVDGAAQEDEQGNFYAGKDRIKGLNFRGGIIFRESTLLSCITAPRAAPRQMHLSPGNPATIPGKIPDLGQWFCVPTFRWVCL